MKIRTIALTSIIVVAALARFLPLPPNFAPISALVIFGAIRYGTRSAGLMVPLLVVLGTDVLREALYHSGLTPYPGFYPGMALLYATYALIGLMATLAHGTRSPVVMATVTLIGTAVFFLLTNFAAWIELTDLYPRTFAGLMSCFEAGIPFLRNTLSGDLAFATILFGSWELAQEYFPALRLAPAAT
jgi:hypothetical protein